MRKKVKYLLMISLFIIIGGSYIINYFNYRYNIKLEDKSMGWAIKYKGLVGSKDFVADGEGNYYIAYKSKIQFIDINGKSYNLFEDEKLNINSLEYLDNKLYFSSNCSIYSLDLKDRKLEELIKDLPNFGDYRDTVIRFNGNYLFASIGAVTNSGVVGPDNLWLKTNTYNHDITPFNIMIKALKFGNENTGAFVPFKTKNVESQIIPGHFPGNASIIQINVKNKELVNFACGIRNISGMDFDSRGKLFASVGGIENRGLRPVQYDYDYLYEIKKGQWYGWPDYSGGDPVNSPRFNNINNPLIIENPPTVNPPAPIYQNKFVSTLGTLAVDKKSVFGKLDSIFFYDLKLSSISELSKEGTLREKLRLNNKSHISSIKFCEGSLMLLDNKTGYIIKVSKVNVPAGNKFTTSFLVGILLVIVIGVYFLMKTFNHKSIK